MLRFIKTTVAGGIVFILPLILIVVLLEKALRLLHAAAAKVLPMFAGYSLSGVTLLSLIAILFLVLACFLAGLLAKTEAALRFVQAIENSVLDKLPGYQLLKDATAHMAGIENLEGAKVGLICEDDGWLFCLVVEAEVDGWVAVYVPDAGPSGPAGGDLRLMPAVLVTITGLAWLPVLACLRRGGHGALVLAQPWLPKPAE